MVGGRPRRWKPVLEPEDLDELEVVCTNCGAEITARVAQRGKCPKCGETPTVEVVSGLDDHRIPQKEARHGRRS